MIKLGQVHDFDTDEFQGLQSATNDVNAALDDPVFIKMLMDATYENTDDDNATIVKNLTADIIVDNIYCEELGWVADHIDHTIAEEDTDGTITCNKSYYDDEDQPSRGNTVFHECAHKAGYSHSYPTQYLSVPYQCGDLYEQYQRAKLAAAQNGSN
jgi:hypothetical protein